MAQASFYIAEAASQNGDTTEDFPKIEAKMKELAKKNEAVVRREVSKAEALAEFKADGQGMWRWEQHGSLPYFHLPELVCRTISFLSLQISII